MTSTQVPAAERAPAAVTARPAAASPDRMPIGNPVGTGQLLAWQVIVALGVVAAVWRADPGRWIVAAAAVLALLLAVPRWRHRWAYQWLLAAWRFSRMYRTLPADSVAFPLTVLPVPLRGGAEAGVVHDGAGFAVVVAVDPRSPGQRHGLTAGTLGQLLELRDDVVSAVQIVAHDDLPGGDPGSRAAAAYRELGYYRVPRSRSTWIVLRHEPTAPGHAAKGTATGRELHASLTRALAGCGPRAADLLGEAGLHGRVLDAEAARAALDAGVLGPRPPQNAAGPGERPLRWASWQDGTRGHVTFWLRRWPAGGLSQLQRALAGPPVLSSAAAVTVSRHGGRLALTAALRVTFHRDADLATIKAAAAAAQRSCGARMVAMDGEHLAGVAATLPAGRAPVAASRWIRRHYSSPDLPLPVGGGGIALGLDARGEPVAAPLFRSEGTRAAVIGDPALSRMLVLRALESGARVQVVTSRPGGWHRLRGSMRIPEDQFPVVGPGAQPPGDGSGMSPWLIIDDTGSPAGTARPWQAAVAVPDAIRGGAGALSGLDVVLLRRVTESRAAAIVAAMGLPATDAAALPRLPGETIGVAVPGSVSLALFDPAGAERAALSASLRGDD